METTDELPEAILNMAQADDVVIVMGAGSIGHVAAKTKELAALMAQVRSSITIT